MSTDNKWKNTNVHKIEKLKNWSRTRKFKCENCNSETPPSLEFKDYRLCLPCVAKELKDNLLCSVDIQDWTLIQFSNFLKKGSVAERLLILWRFEEVMKIVTKNDGTKVFQLYQALVINLGYINQIPLASYVRQAAHEASVLVGESILPVIICIRDDVPAIHYANAVLTAATISHENVEVQRLIKKAVHSNNVGVKKILLNVFEALEDNWVIPVLKMMLTDSNPIVKDRAKNIYAQKVDIEESSETKKIKKVKLSPEFLSKIKSSYSIDSLKMIYDEYLVHFFDIQYFGMKKRLIKAKLKKNDLAHAFAVLLYDKDNFNLLVDEMHEDVFTIFERLVWEGGELSCSNTNPGLSEKISNFEEQDINGKFYTKNIFNPKYSIFVLRKTHNISNEGWVNYYNISLPYFLRDYIKKFLPKPIFFNFIPVKKDPNNCQIFSEKDNILLQLHLIWNYVNEGNIIFPQKSKLLTKMTLNSMISNCSINEFYPDSNHEEKYIRSNLLANFFYAFTSIPIDNKLSPELLLKQFIYFFLDDKSASLYFFSAFCFLNHLKGWQKIIEQYNQEYHYLLEIKFRKDLSNILKKLPVNKWISYENISKYIFYREIPVEIVHLFIAGQYLYYEPCMYMNDEWVPLKGRKYISESNYTHTISEPSIKMYLFLFASLGIIDIAYTYPQNDLERIKNRTYLTVYDGLQYIRLTELGAFILEKTDKFEFDRSQISGEVILDDERLIANIKGKDPVKKMVLEKIAKMIHENCYLVNYKTFLKGCQSTRDIDRKIEMFYEHISKEPPKIWQSFIDDIESKKDPLKEKTNMRVFKVKENQELIDLVARDEKLRKYILISEDYHILVDSRYISLVQARLESFGFFVDM